MKFEFEYGFNKQCLCRFDKYEIKIINKTKYVTPKENSSSSILDFENYENTDEPLLDFINLGKLLLKQPKEADNYALEYINKYGLLGFVYDFPVNRYFTFGREVLLKEFNYINNSDCLSLMKVVDYFSLFFPTCTKEEIKELIGKINDLLHQQSMEKFISPEIDELIYKNIKYYEQLDMIVNYAKYLYNCLKELKKEDSIIWDNIEKVESNHTRINLTYNGLIIHIKSLKEYIDENFKLYAIQEKKYLKICKHCGKVFIAKNPKAEYDTFNCKNQANVYKSRNKSLKN